MKLVLGKFPAQGVVALYYEPNTTGDPMDFDAPRNAPAKSPEDHLSLIVYHSRLDNLAVAAAGTITVNHAAIAAGTGPGGGSSADSVFQWGGVTDDNLLLDFTALGLAAPPFAIVATGDNVIWPGMPVQALAGGRARYVTPTVSTTELRLWETASRTGVSTPAVSIDYACLVFYPPAAPVNGYLEDFDPATGEYQFDQGRWSTARRYLQKRETGSSLGMILGRSLDLKKGAICAVRADASTYEPVPPAKVTVLPGTGVLGPALDYDGTFTGSGAISVQAPTDSTIAVKGFVFDPVAKTMTFAAGDRDTLVVPGGTLVNQLPDDVSITDDAAFVDFPKLSGSDGPYIHRWTAVSVALENWSLTESGTVGVGVTDQEWTQVSALMDAPADTDFFAFLIKLDRTTAPSHSFCGVTIATMVPEDVWIPLTGSIFLEACLGVSRAMSIFIDRDPLSATNGKLVLHQQQSVGPAPGGFGPFGAGEPGSVAPGSYSGGEQVCSDVDGAWPAYFGPNAAPQYRTRAFTNTTFPPHYHAVPAIYRKGGVQQVSIVDPTNYASTWNFELVGRFGRSG